MFQLYGLREIDAEEYRYIGITSASISARFTAHKVHSRSDKLRKLPVHRWMHSKGVENIVCDILDDSATSYEELLSLERKKIAELKEQGHVLLNLTEGGEGALGYKHSEKQKAKWSEERKGSISGEKNPNYGKLGPLSHLYGREVSAKTRKKLSKQKTGSGNPNYGKHHSDDHKRKLSEATKGIPRPASATSAHKRYHINKGVSKPETCKYCKEELN